ncbi:MAG: guanylate kinase [Mariprofundaceae bacterium]|nr:guanylate kinase [Mariprofundaceae bacterium]
MSRMFVISGPSGAGKSSLCSELLRRCSQLKLAISCTTRPPRLGEKDGREYHFFDMETFKSLQDAGEFLEWAKVHGHFYGTRRSDVQAVLEQGGDVLLEIDWQGAAQVASEMSDIVRIFILPPSIEALRQRLVERGQDDMAVIERRIAAAAAEMEHASEAHYQVVNDDFDQALQKLVLLF